MMLAMSVILAHTDSRFDLVGGKLAVQGFFIISGFYMALILTEKYVGSEATKVFWLNRALKIYPAYWLVLALTVSYALARHLLGAAPPPPMVGLYTTPFDFFQTSHPKIGVAELAYLGLTQVGLFFLESIMFLRPTGNFFEFTPNFASSPDQLWLLAFVPQAWTLGLELSFYAIAPFLIRLRLKWLFAILLLSLVLRCFIYFGLSWWNDPWTYRFFPTEIALFLIGFIGYKLTRGLSQPLMQKSGVLLLPIVTLSIALYSYLPIPGKSFLFLCLIAATIPFLFKTTSTWRLDQAVGELSYPVYVVHFLAMMIIRDLSPAIFESRVMYPLAAMVLSILAAYTIKTFFMDRVESVRIANLSRSRIPSTSLN